MTFADLPANLTRVREAIARIQAAEGLSGDVRIVAVTKGHPQAAIGAAVAAGLPDIGENRVQEALAKREGASPAVRWHMVGHLQTNKAKHVPGRFWLVHSVDSVRLSEALAKASRAAQERVQVLIQVNLAAELQKSGCDVADADRVVAAVAAQPELEPLGLMTMAPFTDDPRVQRRVFAGLRALRDRLATPALPLRELSMGMSGDYPAAVAEGATMLRLGTALFGERPV